MERRHPGDRRGCRLYLGHPCQVQYPYRRCQYRYIDAIEAVDDQTVVIKAKLDEDGKAVNPLLVQAYVSSNYVIQKAWTETLIERVGGDPTAFLADPAEDVVYSGPYGKYFADDSKVVYVRDDNYWGQDASMWGKLPVPKYLAHTIFKDNAAGSVALAKGEVDVSQQFNSNIQTLWDSYGLPISTYLPEAPYGIGASLPTAFYNLNSSWFGPACGAQGHRHGR